MRLLIGYPWPGNVRQLEHVLMNAWVMSDAVTIDGPDLTLEPILGPAPLMRAEPATVPKSMEDRRKVEKSRILEALEQSGWNKSKTAEMLNMPRRTLYRRLKAYGIQ